MGFFLSKNVGFIDSMQLMNASLDKLVKNLSDEDWVKEFCSENSEVLKQKDTYPCEYINNFEKVNEEKLPTRTYIFSSSKDGKIGDDG